VVCQTFFPHTYYTISKSRNILKAQPHFCVNFSQSESFYCFAKNEKAKKLFLSKPIILSRDILPIMKEKKKRKKAASILVISSPFFLFWGRKRTKIEFWDLATVTQFGIDNGGVPPPQPALRQTKKKKKRVKNDGGRRPARG